MPTWAGISLTIKSNRTQHNTLHSDTEYDSPLHSHQSLLKFICTSLDHSLQAQGLQSETRLELILKN